MFGYSLDEINKMFQTFPPLANGSLDIERHLRPKLLFLSQTLMRYTFDRQPNIQNTATTAKFDTIDHTVRKIIPPQYYGCRLEKTVAPRHAYLVNTKILPHGKRLFVEDSGGGNIPFHEFLRCSNQSDPRDFISLCNRWEIQYGHQQEQNVTFVHTPQSVAYFENAFHRGLLMTTRSEYANVNSKNAYTCTSGNMIQLLLQHGANPRQVDSSGASLLHWACGTGNGQALHLLVETLLAEYHVESSNAMKQLIGETTRDTRDKATVLHWACCGVGPSRFGTGGVEKFCFCYFMHL